MCFLWKLFRDSFNNAQEFAKLSARRFGPFRILELFGQNSVRLEFFAIILTHPPVHVSNTKPYCDQPKDLTRSTHSTPSPVQESSERNHYEVDLILLHRKRDLGFQWLMLFKIFNTYDAQWQLT